MYLLIISFFSLFFHAGNIAEYEFNLNQENHITLRFTIDNDELMQLKLNDSCDMKQLTALCTSNYINNQTEVWINLEKVHFELENSYTEQNHFILNLKSKQPIKEIKSFKMIANGFYRFLPKFKNRIILNFSNFNKSFLLNAENNQLFLNI
jgi:plasmid maintenance system antidote protein VapI